MKVRTIILEVREDQELGGLGLAPLKAPRDGFNPATSGATVAHDLLEHCNGVAKIGDICDELEALGALWFIRGQWGELNQDGTGSRWSVEENIASDLVRMFREAVAGGAHLPCKVPRTARTDHDDSFNEIIGYFMRDWVQELDSEDHAEAREVLDLYKGLCLAHMRTGLRKASRRFNGESHTANSLFWAVANKVSDLLKREELYEGAQFELTYGLSPQGAVVARYSEHYADY